MYHQVFWHKQVFGHAEVMPKNVCDDFRNSFFLQVDIREKIFRSLHLCYTFPDLILAVMNHSVRLFVSQSTNVTFDVAVHGQQLLCLALFSADAVT